MRRCPSIALLVLLAGAVTVSATASKKAAPTKTGTVVGVVSGDTLLVRLPAGEGRRRQPEEGKKAKPVKPVRVQILGIQAPATPSCFGRESAAQVRALVLGKTVTMEGDIKRSVYISLPGTDDLGRMLVGRGTAQVDSAAGAFSRVDSYVPLQEEAEHGATGNVGRVRGGRFRDDVRARHRLRRPGHQVQRRREQRRPVDSRRSRAPASSGELRRDARFGLHRERNVRREGVDGDVRHQRHRLRAEA